MLVLALDTATTRIVAGLVELAGDAQRSSTRVPVGAGTAARTLAAVEREGARAHAELLAPAIAEVLDTAGADRRDLDALVCGVGPGPFTGLRVGMVTAAALGDALGRPVHPVATHLALLHDARVDAATDAAPAARLAVSDARRREVYWALADVDGTVTGPSVSTPADLAARVTEHHADVLARSAERGRPVFDTVAVGDAAPALAALVPGLAVGDRPAPSPGALVAVASADLAAGTPPAPLVPLYLRRPDAVPPGAPKTVRR